VGLAFNRIGSVVLVAGVIMFIAFGGLVFSPVASMAQTGFLLSVGVMVETIVNTLIITPTLMMIVGDYC